MQKVLTKEQALKYREELAQHRKVPLPKNEKGEVLLPNIDNNGKRIQISNVVTNIHNYPKARDEDDPEFGTYDSEEEDEWFRTRKSPDN